MTRKISLSVYLTVSCLCISLLPVIIYSLLSPFFFMGGIDSVHELQLKKYITDYINNKDNSQTSFITITENYNQLPADVKEVIPEHIERDIFHKYFINGNNKGPLYFILAHKINNKIYYATQMILREDAEAYLLPQIKYTNYILIGAAVIILFTLSIFLKFLINRIKYPIMILGKWATNLNSTNVEDPLPDFTYPELQNIADIIQKSLKKEYSSLNKEELFWRYCSHELRAPISVIDVGIAVLQRLITEVPRNQQKERKALLRLKRSSQLMSQIINNLLWLGRNETAPLHPQNIELSGMIGEIILDMNKIFPNHDHLIKVRTSPYIVCMPYGALRIMLENIIRNAYQHTQSGEIYILQTKNKITVINSINCCNNLPENVGFGLGMQITERLAKRFGWNLKCYKNDKFNIIKLELPV